MVGIAWHKTPAAQMKQQQHHFRILFACPEAPMAHILTHSLRTLGAEVEMITSHKALLRRIGQRHYDLLLTRHAEPLLASRAWVEQLRKTGHVGRLWLIADHLSAEQSVALIERGVEQLFTLPVSTQRIIRRVKCKMSGRLSAIGEQQVVGRGSLTILIYRFLTGAEEGEAGALLLLYAPRGYERRRLAGEVAAIVRCVAECRAERVRMLSRAWGLERLLTRRILHRRGAVRREAFEQLLLLHPSAECVEQIARHHFTSSESALSQLLLVIHASPTLVESLLARHPYTLTWEEVGRVVGLLKRRQHILAPPTVEGAVACGNVALYMLYLSVEEGVGKVGELAPLFATAHDDRLRTHALNALFREAMFAPRSENGVGS